MLIWKPDRPGAVVVWVPAWVVMALEPMATFQADQSGRVSGAPPIGRFGVDLS